MMNQGVSAGRGCGLVVGLRVRRLINMSIRGGRWSGEGKQRANLILLSIIAPLVAFHAHVLSGHVLWWGERALGAGGLMEFVSTELFVLFSVSVADEVV